MVKLLTLAYGLPLRVVFIILLLVCCFVLVEAAEAPPSVSEVDIFV